MEGNVRRLQPGSIPTVWRKSEKSVDQPLSHRSRRKVRIKCFYFFFSSYIRCELSATCFSLDILQNLPIPSFALVQD